MMYSNAKEVRPLTVDQMRAYAPSIFAEQAAPEVSDRYLFIPTWEILERVMSETGLQPVRVREQSVRLESRREFARHEIVLRDPNDAGRKLAVGDSVFELRMTNAHNRMSAYMLDAGLMRLVCSNGMMVSDSVLPGVRVRHTGKEEMIGRIIEGTYEVVRDLPQVSESIQRMQAVQLAQPEQVALAEAAALLRWDEGAAPVAPSRLLAVRRHADKGDDAWRVMNRIQENVMRGGQSGYTVDANNRTRRVTTRAVKSISEDQRINKALWKLTEEMLKLKATA